MQEALVLVLMIVFSMAVFYSNIALQYKIVVSVLVFGIIFLAGLFNQALKRKEDVPR